MLTLTLLVTSSLVATPGQPAVSPGPNEPGLAPLLKTQFDLDMDHDLRNPVLERAPAALFTKVDPDKPVTFAPIIAWGVETPTHGGWYRAGPGAADLPDDAARAKVELWSYAFKQPPAQLNADAYTPPPLASGEVTFDPGVSPFGLWISNEAFKDGGVFTQPGLVARVNERLHAQPYKAMIYPNYDAKKRRAIPNSYIIGWEYSTNDDFQDAVTRIDNVRLLPGEPALAGVLEAGATTKKLAGGFKFVEGPAWDFTNNVLYFSDIPESAIMAYSEGKARVAKKYEGQTNGLMFDKDGRLVGCEHKGRRVSRDILTDRPQAIAMQYQNKKLNSPNDLWFDASGGLYFTDPRYGPRENLEQDKEAVYYVANDGQLKRVIANLVRPNGIALSPAGDWLYVVDNGSERLYRYKVEKPGALGPAELIAHIPGPDGMTVDREGRLYVTSVDGVAVLDLNGKWLSAIPAPEQPANCTFGDKDWSTLYITARTGLYSIPTQTRGWHVHLDGMPEKVK
jgi:sugar lactone lactonase YvrE